MINDSPLAQAFWKNGRCDDCPVIDMHGHMGRFRGIWFPRDTPEAMIRTMEGAGVRLLCFSHHVSLSVGELANAPAVEAVRKYPHRLRAYMAVNPHYGEAVDQALASWQDYRDVYVGFKLHPSWNRTPLDSPAYEKVLRFASERSLPVLVHTWGDDPVCDAGAVRRAAGRHPDCRLLLAHSLHDRWDEAVKAALDFPNIYLELTAVLDNRGALEKFVSAGLGRRLLFGTDLPWFDPHHGIGAVLSADITDADRRNILHRNAEELLASAGTALYLSVVTW
jgi:predicted TIM-barrel fold metal-dependent hydrolase